jgi:hypothetical protein
MLAHELFLDQMIESQRRAMRYYLVFAGAIFTLGLIIIVVAYVIAESILPDVLKHILALGGGFVSSLSSLQLKEIVARKEREEMFITLRVRLAEIKLTGETQDDSLYKRFDELLWKIVEKTTAG